MDSATLFLQLINIINPSVREIDFILFRLSEYIYCYPSSFLTAPCKILRISINASLKKITDLQLTLDPHLNFIKRRQDTISPPP